MTWSNLNYPRKTAGKFWRSSDLCVIGRSGVGNGASRKAFLLKLPEAGYSEVRRGPWKGEAFLGRPGLLPPRGKFFLVC